MLYETKKMSCSDCDRYEVGCEETCPYMLRDDEERESLLKKRKAMKAEKSKAVGKAEILSRSAAKSKGQKNLYETPKKGYQKAEANLDKQRERREKRIKKNEK